MARVRRGEVSLTVRQREVLALVAKGHTNGEIGEILGISLGGAKWHVTELLTRFEVETREELVQRAKEERGRRHIPGIGWGLGGVTLSKAVVVAVGAVILVGGTGALLLAMTESPGQGVAGATADGVDTKAQQARAKAEEHALAALSRIDEYLPVRPPVVSDLAVTHVERHTNVDTVTAADTDRFWQGSERVDAWYFRFEVHLAVTGSLAFNSLTGVLPGDFVVDVVMRDGTWEPLGSNVELRILGELKDSAGSNLMSRAQMKDREREQAATGDTILLAYLDDLPGPVRMEGYRNVAGGLCKWTYEFEMSMYSCSDGTGHIEQLVLESGGVMAVPGFTRGSGPMQHRAELVFPAHITHFDLVATDGSTRRFQTRPLPPAFGLDVTFAYVSVDTSNGPPIVVAYDSSGEAGRWPVEVTLPVRP